MLDPEEALYTALDCGNPTTGDGFRVYISPTATASYQPATQRYMHLLVQADNPYVDPTYGPKNAGPSMKIFANYEGVAADQKLTH